MTMTFTRLTHTILALSLALSFSLTSTASGSAQVEQGRIRRVRSLDSEETGLSHPVGLAFSSSSQNFYVVEDRNQGQNPASSTTEIIALASHAQDKDQVRLEEYVEDPLNIVFDDKSNRLLAFQPTTGELIEVREKPGGRLDRAPAASRNFGTVNLQAPSGAALDARTGSLFLLDAVGPQVIRLQLGSNSTPARRVSVVNLASSGLVFPRGIAFDPTTGHLHVLDLSYQMLFEIDQSGKVLASRDLAPFNLKSPQAMVFAPSGDQTDNPAQMSLFVADSGLASDGTGAFPQSRGQIVEFSFVQTAALPSGTTLLPTTLVQVIDTSNAVWNPSAPDPAGVDYWPLTGRLLISDSEVDEMPNYFTGKNVFDSTLSGALVSTCSTTNSSRTGFSNEPNGIAINRNNNRIYFTDDNANMVHEVSLGPDGQYCTADDQLTSVNLGLVYNIQDAEDVAYGSSRLFIAGGTDAEVYVIPLGADGILGGGDDGPLTQFDTYALGFTDLEGIGYNWDNNTLMIVSADTAEKYLGEVTIAGTLLNVYDLNYLELTHREDATYAPSSQNPAVKSIYVADRGIDNNTNSSENDGQIWELSIIPPNTPTPTNTLPPGTVGDLRYLSFAINGTVNGVAFADEDIVRFDGQSWSLFFDGSDVGAGSVDLFAFSVLDADSFLMAFSANVTLSGLAVTPQDIVRFDATSLGSNTAGTFSMYFNGPDVGLADTSAEKIDAVGVLADGRILLSTTGNPVVTGVSSGRDEDILAFTPTSLGTNTAGAWAMYFDGSDVGLSESSTEDIDALDVVNGAIYLSTTGVFTVNGVTGAGEDVFVCTPIVLGDTTGCSYASTLFFDGSAWGLSGNSVDGFSLSPTNPPTPTNTPTPTATGVVIPTNTPTPTPTSSSTPTNTPTPTATSSSGSTILTFTPNADAYVRSSDPAVNYGTATTVRAYQSGSSVTNSHLRFSVTGITGPVQSAKLRLYVTDASSIGGGTLYQTVDNNWTETGINYTNQPSTTGSALATLGPVGAGIWIEIDASSLVTADGVYTFGLLGNSSDAAYYASRETLNRPELVVTYANPN